MAIALIERVLIADNTKIMSKSEDIDIPCLRNDFWESGRNVLKYSKGIYWDYQIDALAIEHTMGNTNAN